MLDLIHSIERHLNRRLTDGEYELVLQYIENEDRINSICNGLSYLLNWANNLPKDVKENLERNLKEREMNKHF
ncbi:hypothetical protein ABWK22_01755 [Gottfriedia acidiceleris]|uniref:hypothetical protein n=1 Tax=Gottfriedia acidiceleris TaxID=371036 RepID=UPI003398D35F